MRKKGYCGVNSNEKGIIKMSKVSFVIPCYRSAKTLEGVVAEIRETMQSMTAYEYDIFLVNDCSPDDTYEVITALAKNIKI